VKVTQSDFISLFCALKHRTPQFTLLVMYHIDMANLSSEHKTFEDHLFYVLAEGKECVSASKILQVC
jgi:hypothetical protein